ncbi:putative lipoprotein [Clostridium botulinum C str. Eklund]|nr:putative lipoprotein [Clostridium botulinum C str. Eklund]NEZ48755.1 hypothetical protein [Clostridium botulinum]
MKKFLKIIMPIALMFLTSCNMPSKQALGYTGKTINLAKDINNISSIRYLGQGVYAVNTATDKKLAKYKLMDSSGNLISDNIFYDVDFDLKFNVQKIIPVMVTDFTKHKKLKYRLINTKGKFVSKSYEAISLITKDIYEVL